MWVMVSRLGLGLRLLLGGLGWGWRGRRMDGVGFGVWGGGSCICDFGWDLDFVDMI